MRSQKDGLDLTDMYVVQLTMLVRAGSPDDVQEVISDALEDALDNPHSGLLDWDYGDERGAYGNHAEPRPVQAHEMERFSGYVSQARAERRAQLQAAMAREYGPPTVEGL